LYGQEVERLALINRQPQAGREALGTDLIAPEATGPKALVETPIPGLNSGDSDIRDWDVVASGPVVHPPLSQGIVIGKMRGRGIHEVPREVLVDPIGIGTPGAYVARVASPVYTREEMGGLSDIEETSESKSGTCGVKSVEVNANGVSSVGKELSLQASKSNAARYGVLKILNNSRQHMKLGTAEAILQCTPG